MDALLVLMVVIWGANYSVIKRCFVEIPPIPFNALRMALASAVFYAGIQVARRRARVRGSRLSSIFYTPHPLTTADRWRLLWLGVVGHMGYQLCFVSGVALTTVSNGALIIGTTPVVVATASAALGHERIARLHWIGAAISVIGLYFVVGHGAAFGGASTRGDVLVMLSVCCWSAYTIGATSLIERHSPLYVTGTTMAIGTIPYGIVAIPHLLDLDWHVISGWVWVALVLSAVLALCLSYLIWYTAVQRIGPARTSVYSNLVPIVAMTFAWLWLGEPIPGRKMVGALAVLAGVFFTRFARKSGPVPALEE